eukprot:TRINITY_DN3441_c0_g1_i9.p2 TRINITY_DN3441_c0_g1~~TRINITY_DN3441_c0_g1_i9.p2  ORF type:complete len:227 (-),score=-12.97 TRINITY_DN3441_c0_g1_i9:600-1280(-)
MKPRYLQQLSLVSFFPYFCQEKLQDCQLEKKSYSSAEKSLESKLAKLIPKNFLYCNDSGHSNDVNQQFTQCLRCVLATMNVFYHLYFQKSDPRVDPFLQPVLLYSSKLHLNFLTLFENFCSIFFNKNLKSRQYNFGSSELQSDDLVVGFLIKHLIFIDILIIYFPFQLTLHYLFLFYIGFLCILINQLINQSWIIQRELLNCRQHNQIKQKFFLEIISFFSQESCR